MEYNGLKIFDITLVEDDVGIKATSMVTLPAIESGFLHFNKDKPQFIFSNEEKREVVGAFMIPNKPIYRDINGYKFYVNFTEDVIRQLTTKMLKSGTAGIFTIQHKNDVPDGDIDIQEVWIKETESDKSVGFGIDECIGTAFMKVKVNDERIWNQVKEYGLTGFSIELDASIVERNELLFNTNKNIKMSIKDVFKNAITVDGVELHFNSDLKKNTYLVSEGEDGQAVAYNGEFNHENVVYKVEDGVVKDVENIELSTQESIKDLVSEFSTLKSGVESLLLSKKAIEDKEAELDLLKTQFAAEKLDFAKQKEAAGASKVKVNLNKQISDAGAIGKSWLGKFVY